MAARHSHTLSYFPIFSHKKPPSILSPAYAAYSGIRYNIVRRTPACRAIELGRFGRVWEVLGSGQSPLQPVDALFLPATRRVTPCLSHAHYRTSWRQCTQKLPTLPKPSQYFSQKPPSTAPPAYAEYSSIRYNIVRRTPACRATELGRFGRVWEVLGSGQSPLQPVDAPLLLARRWVMPRL